MKLAYIYILTLFRQPLLGSRLSTLPSGTSESFIVSLSDYLDRQGYRNRKWFGPLYFDCTVQAHTFAVSVKDGLSRTTLKVLTSTSDPGVERDIFLDNILSFSINHDWRLQELSSTFHLELTWSEEEETNFFEDHLGPLRKSTIIWKHINGYPQRSAVIMLEDQNIIFHRMHIMLVEAGGLVGPMFFELRNRITDFEHNQSGEVIMNI